jgi:hypothetical protein
MYIFWNNNPEGIKIGDCVVRAISEAMGQTWERTYIDLCIEGFMFADMPNSNAVWAAYLHSHGWKKHIVPDSCPDCYTFGDFAAEHTTGTYIVATGSHVACVKDGGKLLDNWDSSGETVAYYFERSV